MRFEEFIKQYNEIYKAYNKIYHEFANCFGLSDSASNILYELRITGCGITQKDIGSALSLSKQTVNSSIKSLEKQGLIVCKDCDGDKRMKYVELTKEGETFCSLNTDKILRAEHSTYERLAEEEAKSLLSAERKYYELFLQESMKIFGNKGEKDE